MTEDDSTVWLRAWRLALWS